MAKKSNVGLQSVPRFFAGRAFFLTVCIVPTFVLFAIFMLYPIVDLIRVSFYSWDGLLADMKFVGFKYFSMSILYQAIELSEMFFCAIIMS